MWNSFWEGAFKRAFTKVEVPLADVSHQSDNISRSNEGTNFRDCRAGFSQSFFLQKDFDATWVYQGLIYRGRRIDFCKACPLRLINYWWIPDKRKIANRSIMYYSDTEFREGVIPAFSGFSDKFINEACRILVWFLEQSGLHSMILILPSRKFFKQ